MIKLSDAKSINVYRDGAWQNQKMGYVYFNGEWVPFIEYYKWLYQEGIKSEGLKFRPKFREVDIYSYLRTSEEPSFLRFYGKGNFGEYINLSTDNMIDVTEYNYLCSEWSASTDVTEVEIHMGVSSRNQPNLTTYYAVSKNRIKDSVEREVTRLDISDIKESVYPVFKFYHRLGFESNTECKVYKLWLE